MNAIAGTELMYQQAEPIFGAYAKALTDLGWSVFPQESDGGRRPGSAGGEMIKWGRLKDRAPTPNEREDWQLHCARLNVACAFGPASGNTFAVDIDITDRRLSDDVLALAQEILGDTPFIREGMCPKLALIYRHGDGDGEAIPSLSRRFADRPEDGLEILGAGKPLTIYGRHHKTGNYFQWLGSSQPLLSRPSAAPLVTHGQIARFLDAVQRLAPFLAMTSNITPGIGSGSGWREVTGDGIALPVLSDGPWVRGASGRITDGRYSYMSALVARTVRRNCPTLGHAQDRQLLARITAAVVKEFEASTEPSPRWHSARLGNIVAGDVSRFAGKLAAGWQQ